MLAHIRNSTLIRIYDNGKGRVILENGDTVSPPIIGYVNGNDKIVSYTEETVDNSTTSFTESKKEIIVNSDSVVKRKTITDIPIETLRSRASIARGQFALIAKQQGWITEAEALAWAGGTAIPSWVEAIIDTNVAVEDRLDTKIKVLTDLTVKRTGNLMPMLQAEKSVSDNDLDVIFGIADPVSPLTP